MSAEVRLWIDYVSPYAFVAKAGAYELERDYDIALSWRPYTLDVRSVMGAVEEREPRSWRAKAAPSTTGCATRRRRRAFSVCPLSCSRANCSGAATGSACCASGWT